MKIVIHIVCWTMLNFLFIFLSFVFFLYCLVSNMVGLQIFFFLVFFQCQPYLPSRDFLSVSTLSTFQRFITSLCYYNVALTILCLRHDNNLGDNKFFSVLWWHKWSYRFHVFALPPQHHVQTTHNKHSSNYTEHACF